MYDSVEFESLSVEPGIKWLVYSLCGLRNDPDKLTTSDKFRVSCVEALRFGYLMSKYLDVDKEEFIEGLYAVMDLEDNVERKCH
jgi:hypothetical protein